MLQLLRLMYILGKYISNVKCPVVSGGKVVLNTMSKCTQVYLNSLFYRSQQLWNGLTQSKCCYAEGRYSTTVYNMYKEGARGAFRFL